MTMFSRVPGRLRAWWRTLTRPTQLERDMRDEMAFHVDGAQKPACPGGRSAPDGLELTPPDS